MTDEEAATIEAAHLASINEIAAICRQRTAERDAALARAEAAERKLAIPDAGREMWDAMLERAEAAEAKLGEAVGLLRRIAKMGRDVIQPTRIERDCIAWEDRFAARPSPAPTEPAPSELARLREFARSVFEEHSCGEECEDDEGNPVDPTECPCGGDECWRCAAAQALKPSSWAPAPTEAPAPGTEEKEPTR